MKTFISIFTFLFVAPLFATEIVWYEMYGDYHYQDIDKTCKNGPSYVPVYLSLQVDNGVANLGYLRKNFYNFSRSAKLSGAELKSVSLVRDAKGRLWIKNIRFRPSTMFFIMESLHFGVLKCFKEPISTAKEALRLDFDLEGVDTVVSVVISNKLRFGGTLKSGKAYSADITLNHQHYYGEED